MKTHRHSPAPTDAPIARVARTAPSRVESFAAAHGNAVIAGVASAAPSPRVFRNIASPTLARFNDMSHTGRRGAGASTPPPPSPAPRTSADGHDEFDPADDRASSQAPASAGAGPSDGSAATSGAGTSPAELRRQGEGIVADARRPGFRQSSAYDQRMVRDAAGRIGNGLLNALPPDRIRLDASSDAADRVRWDTGMRALQRYAPMTDQALRRLPALEFDRALRELNGAIDTRPWARLPTDQQRAYRDHVERIARLGPGPTVARPATIGRDTGGGQRLRTREEIARRLDSIRGMGPLGCLTTALRLWAGDDIDSAVEAGSQMAALDQFLMALGETRGNRLVGAQAPPRTPLQPENTAPASPSAPPAPRQPALGAPAGPGPAPGSGAAGGSRVPGEREALIPPAPPGGGAPPQPASASRGPVLARPGGADPGGDRPTSPETPSSRQRDTQPTPSSPGPRDTQPDGPTSGSAPPGTPNPGFRRDTHPEGWGATRTSGQLRPAAPGAAPPTRGAGTPFTADEVNTMLQRSLGEGGVSAVRVHANAESMAREVAREMGAGWSANGSVVTGPGGHTQDFARYTGIAARGSSRIHVIRGACLATTVHEALHTVSTRTPATLNYLGRFWEEGMTELLALQLAGPAAGRPAYVENVAFARLLRRHVGEAVMDAGYLRGEQAGVQRALEQLMGAAPAARWIAELQRAPTQLSPSQAIVLRRPFMDAVTRGLPGASGP